MSSGRHERSPDASGLDAARVPTVAERMGSLLPWRDVTDRIPGVPLYAIAGLFGTLEILRYVLTADRLLLDSAELVVLILVAAGYAMLGHRIAARVPPRRIRRIAGLSALFGVAGGLVAGMTVVFARLAGDPLFEEGFILLLGSSMTALVGLVVGYYFFGFRARYRDLQQAFDRQRRLSRELSITHRVLRHNLRNELTVIEGHASLAREATIDRSTEPAGVEEHFDVLADHLETVQGLCDKAAELADVTLDADRRTMDAAAELEAAVARLEADHPDVALEVATPASADVLAHPRLPTALDELLENAVEHTDAGTVTVTASVDPADGVADHTRIEIADTGRGIPEMEVENLRQPEEDSLSHGQGLGLWVAYTIIEQSGGDLTYRENAPTGTVATIHLQPADADPPAPSQRGRHRDPVSTRR